LPRTKSESKLLPFRKTLINLKFEIICWQKKNAHTPVHAQFPAHTHRLQVFTNDLWAWVGVQLSSLVEAQKLFSFWPGTNFQEAGNLSSLQEFSFFLLHFSLSLSFQFHFPFSFHISPLAVGANIYPVIPNYTNSGNCAVQPSEKATLTACLPAVAACCRNPGSRIQDTGRRIGHGCDGTGWSEMVWKWARQKGKLLIK